jgi:hypothetical protein
MAGERGTTRYSGTRRDTSHAVLIARPITSGAAMADGVSPIAGTVTFDCQVGRDESSRCDGCGDAVIRKSRRRRCPAAFLLAGIIRQRYHAMNEMKQLPPADVLDLMLVFVGALTERAVVIPERY